MYTYSEFEPADARRVYANFEQPDLKAAFTFHVAVPASWTVLSNQPRAEPGRPGRPAVWHFPPTPRISTYLTAVVAGEYHVLRDAHTTPAGQLIPLALACRRRWRPPRRRPTCSAITRPGLDYFTGLFGWTTRSPSTTRCSCPTSAGAMENVGCVAITEQLLFRSKVTDAMYELRAMMILHEMAHSGSATWSPCAGGMTCG